MKRFLWRLAGRIIAWVFRLLCTTWRVRIEGRSIIDELDTSNRPVIWVFWHGRQAVLYKARKPKDHVVLVSNSKDGEIQAGALSSFGARVVRGSASRGGAAGMMALSKKLKQGFHAALAVDGPRGPLNSVKKGAAALAGATRAYLAPISAAGGPAWIFHKAWDRFVLPKPFARVVVAVAEPIEVGSTSTTEVEEATKVLKQRLDKATATAESILRDLSRTRGSSNT